ncbi:MAG: hypothetical protein EXQ94_05345 [Alphaproteobacteria bacterium]|nr:hypothetical protein [Alphaproteobacteria bacterium]
MCTVIILRRPDHRWPLLLGANRDEKVARPTAPPARHWPDRPRAVAGRDLEAGGTWLGMNDDGVVAAVMNRVGSLGPEPGKRSRGELPLLALDHRTAKDAAIALARLDVAAYRPFNLVVVDAHDAYWFARRPKHREMTVQRLPDGLSMLTARDVNDLASPRIRTFLPRLIVAEPPDPDRNDWCGWSALLASHRPAEGQSPLETMTIPETDGFATVSSSLIALPRADVVGVSQWHYADGPPDRAPFLAVPTVGSGN